jgi:NAD(P)-dependent dehydrogenase (short-subunit alcohol dehydrogenase family)
MTRYALITGASGGLSRALAQRLAGSGWSLVLVSRNPAAIMPSGDFTPLVIEADCASSAGASQAMKEATSRLGSPPAALAHCAGNTLITPLHKTSDEQYRQVLSANLDSAFFTLRAWIQACLEHQCGGAAVLVSSVVAGVGVANHEAIAVCKGAIEALVRSTAATYSGKGIRVNAIAPGLLKSPLTDRLFVGNAERFIAAQYPLGRYGSVEDGAAAMEWLLSDEASWITGQVLPVDGGFSAVRPTVKP